jgi:hypothetical protein
MTSKWGYAVGVVVILLGFAIGFGLMLPNLFGLLDGVRQVRVPGEVELALEPGEYTVFHEYQTTFEGTLYSNTNITGLSLSVTGPDGAAVPIEPATVSSRYSISGRFGISVWQFVVTEPGTYDIAAAYPPGSDGDPAILGIGSDFMSGLVFMILRTVGITLAGGLIGALIIVMTHVRRKRAMRAGAARA